MMSLAVTSPMISSVSLTTNNRRTPAVFIFRSAASIDIPASAVTGVTAAKSVMTVVAGLSSCTSASGRVSGPNDDRGWSGIPGSTLNGRFIAHLHEGRVGPRRLWYARRAGAHTPPPRRPTGRGLGGSMLTGRQ
jgi:hypothetical protein